MKIKFLNGSISGMEREYQLQTITIGRDGGNTICLDSAGVSRCHARLYQDQQGFWFIGDCNSTNGVKVNGNRIFNDTRVQEGDLLDIGQQQMMILSFSAQTGPVVFNPVITAPLPEVQNALPPGNPFDKTVELPQTPAVHPVPVPTPAQPEAPAEKDDPKNLLGNLKNLGPLFGRGGKHPAANGAGQSAPEPDKKKKRLSNLTFYAILGCVVIIVLSVVLREPDKKSAAGSVQALPLALTYEKTVISRDNVFRFEFKLYRKKVTPDALAAGKKKSAQGKMEAAPVKSQWVYMGSFTLDDLGSQRHYSKETELSDETVDRMRNVIQGSGILALQNSILPPDRSMNRKLQLVLGSKIMKFTVPGEFAGNEFSNIEDAVLGIAEGFGLQTIALTPEQLLNQAEQNFRKAEDLFENRAVPSNLRDAIIRYRAVVEALEQFSPKPQMWDRARKQLNAAEAERKAKLESMNSEFSRLKQIQDYEGMRGIYLRIMELTEPESRNYNAAKKRLIIIDQTLRKKRK